MVDNEQLSERPFGGPCQEDPGHRALVHADQRISSLDAKQSQGFVGNWDASVIPSVMTRMIVDPVWFTSGRWQDDTFVRFPNAFAMLLLLTMNTGRSSSTISKKNFPRRGEYLSYSPTVGTRSNIPPPNSLWHGFDSS